MLVAHNGPVTAAQLDYAALLHAGRGAALAGLTGLAMDGLRGFPSPLRHVLVSPGRHPVEQRGIAVHRNRVEDRDVHPTRWPVRTKVPRSLVDAAAWAGSDDDAVAVLAAGVQQGLATASHVEEVARALPTLRRRRLILATLRDISGGAHSLPEVEFAQLVRRFRLPVPTRQVVRCQHGRRRYLDVYWDDHGVAVEIDGAAHTDVRQWWRDMERQNELVVSGDLVLRFPAYLIRTAPELAAEQIRRAFLARRPTVTVSGCRGNHKRSQPRSDTSATGPRAGA